MSQRDTVDFPGVFFLGMRLVSLILMHFLGVLDT